MVQTKRKTNVVALAIVMSLVLVFAMAVALFAMPATDTAHAATAVIDSLSLANINAGNGEGKYGNFSWDNTKIKSISASEMTTDRDKDPLCIVWTRPANGAYASALTFSVNITDSVGAITIRYDASVPSYISPGEKQSGTLTETVNSLYSTYEKIYFYISCSYMYNNVHLTSVSIQIKATTYPMTFTKGAGIKEAYLSTDSNATSGSASGTAYAKYSTVYCFAKLAEGYKAQSGWTLIDGTANSEDAIYRVGTYSNISAAYSFGTINAVEKQKYLYRNLNGGGSISGINLTYNQTANLSIPSRTGYTFLAWNTNAAGTGTAYGNSTDATLTAEQVNAIIADDSITYVYAQWEANEYNVIVNGDNQNLTYGSNFDLTPTMPEEGYTFRGYFDGENGTGTQYTDADGHSIRTWDKAEDDTHLYAYFTKDMAVVSVGYEADYDGEAHGITVNVTDPADGYTILYGEVEDSYTMEEITKTTAGTYTIYFKITKNGYNDYYGSAVIKINKADAVLTAPTAKTGLHYTGVAQELVNAGSTTGGTIEYKLNDGEWSADIPTAINVDDDYIVSYRVVGGTNFNDIAGVALSEAIEIEENDKTLLAFTLELANSYYGTIAAEHPTVADVLDDTIDAANAVLDNANKTEEEISTAVETLTGAVLNAQVGVVEEKIDAIPSPVTLDSEVEIIAAREAYDNLSDDQQTQVINRDALFAAEIDLAEALIADIGEVVYTTGCKGKIDKARDYFDALTEEQQALVDDEHKDELADAEEAYDKLAADNAAADAVDALIGQIPDPVVYTSDCKDKIDAARAAHNALTADQKALVDDEQDLLDAEAAYASLKAADDQEKADAVIALINAIDDPVDYPESGDGIKAARDAYEALTEEQQALVDNYETLTNAENEYEAQKNAGVEDVEGLIDAIGAVTYPDSKEAIDAAKDAFDALTEEQQALVDDEHKDALADAEAAYKALEDAAKAGAAKALIEAIGEVEDTQSSKDKIDAAREAYDALTDDQKALITEDAPTIVTAETTYNTLHNNNLAAAEVIALIEAIGKVEDTQDSKNAIDAARDAYDALTDDQKALIAEDEPTIVTAEATYNTLHANNLAAAEVVALINAIGTVEYTETSKGKIDAAKEAYNDLTDAQKAIVDNYLTENEVDTIVVSETIYIGLGDQQKAQEVKDLIVAIGEVKYPDSKDKIEAARGSYDALTDTQKALVDNYSVLTTAEATYAELEAKSNKKLSGGAIAGIVIGCVAFVAIVCFLLWFFLFKKKKEDKDEPKVAVPETNDEPKNDQTDEPKE